MVKGKESVINGSVLVTRRQAATYSGKSLRTVELIEQGYVLCVNKKRPRGNKFDNHYFHIADVIGYVEGDGGLKSAAYATVMTDVTLRAVEGVISFDGDYIKVYDEDGTTHTFQRSSEISIKIIEELGRGEPGEDDDEEPAPRKGDPVDKDEDDDEIPVRRRVKPDFDEEEVAPRVKKKPVEVEVLRSRKRVEEPVRKRVRDDDDWGTKKKPREDVSDVRGSAKPTAKRSSVNF